MLRSVHFIGRLTAVVPFVALLVVSLSANASIMLPDERSPNVDQLLAEPGTTSVPVAASATSTSESTPSPTKGQHNDSQEKLLARLLITNSSTGGSSSGTSSSGGASGSAPSALAYDISSFSDADIVVWTYSERRFTLPTPPGIDLLRPPRY